MAESQYVSIAASKSGQALKAVPKISKHLVAYVAGLDAVSPYMGCPFDHDPAYDTTAATTTAYDTTAATTTNATIFIIVECLPTSTSYILPTCP